MLCEAFIIAWNEIETIELTIKHYQKFCDKITLYDNYSSDGTDQVAERMGCTVIKFGVQGVLSDKYYRIVKNSCWKKSTAQWVVIVDCDEILDVSRETLQNATTEGHTIFKTSGWQVISQDMPKEDYSEITKGYPDESYSKLVIFNPKALTDINYVYGCHVAEPTGKVVYSPQVLTLFHYRQIGGAERLIQRHRIYRKRMSELNVRLGLGIHYMTPEQAKEAGLEHPAAKTDEDRRKEWEDLCQKSVEYLRVGGLSSAATTNP